LGKLLGGLIAQQANLQNIPYAVVVKSADETRNSDITQTPDSEIKFNARANKTYFVQLYLATNSHVTADFDYAFTVPSGTAELINSTWDANTNQTFEDWTAEQFLTGAGVDVAVIIYGRMNIGATGGEVNLTWAQNVSNAGNTSVLAGTTIIVYES
jgi:hypothetical protein